MIEVSTQVDIDAPAEAVWEVLLDLAGYPAWNPFIQRATGTPTIGGQVHLRVRSSFGIPLGFRATVLSRTDERELHWIGHVAQPWLASGEHWFTLEPVGPGRVRFAQREVFRGVMPRLAKRLLVREARRGFDAMNGALKVTAEARAPKQLRRVR